MTHWLDKLLDIFSADSAELRSLAIVAGGDPETFYIGTDMRGADLRGQDLRGMKFTHLDLASVLIDQDTKLEGLADELALLDNVDELRANFEFVKIRKMKRQEERLAVILKIFLDRPELRNFIKNNYRDKAKFTRDAIDKLLDWTDKEDLFGEKYEELDFGSFLEHVINNSFPLNRGFLLLYLAKYFGYDPLVIRVIRKRLRNNFTMSQHIKPIEDILKEWQEDKPNLHPNS